MIASKCTSVRCHSRMERPRLRKRELLRLTTAAVLRSV
jgi:hypothetical protein